MNRRGPENAIPLFLLAVLMIPALWTAQGVVWSAPWCLTFSLYFVGTGLGLISVWLMVGWSVWQPSVAEVSVYVLGLLLLAGLTEGIARLLPGAAHGPSFGLSTKPSKIGPGFVPDAAFGWRLAPGSVATWDGPGNIDAYSADADGFRAVTSTAPATAAPLVFVGDDVTFGTGVAAEQTFGALAAAAMKRPTTLRALPGYGPAVTLNVLVEEALPAAADILVVPFIDPGWRAIVPGPAGSASWPRPTFLVDAGEVRLWDRDDTAEPTFRWLLENSAGWRGLYALDRQLGRFMAWGGDAIVYQHVFTQMVERAAEADRQLLFVRLPLPVPTEHPFFQDVLHALGAPYLDLAGISARAPADLHFPGTALLNAKGHRWVAVRLRRRLARLLAD